MPPQAPRRPAPRRPTSPLALARPCPPSPAPRPPLALPGAGLEKLPYYDSRANTDTLLLRRCSRASAAQRAGRAGRVAPGVCLRLYPAEFLVDESLMPAYTPAEMQRTSLLNLILKVTSLTNFTT